MSELIAFIGVGNMGNPMAQNLVKAVKILGIKMVKPWELFAKPLDAVPRITAIIKII